MVAIEWQLLSSRSRWASGFASLLLVPALASLLLTESRGALLALLGAALLSLVLGGRRNLGHRLGTAGVSLAFASLAARWAFDTMRAGDPGNGAWLLAAAAIVGAALLLGLRREADRYGQSFDSSGRVRLVLPGKRFSLASPLWGAILLLIGCAAAYLLLARGEAGGARLDGHYETASARWLYYADALRMFHDRPWIGAGGESWRMLASQYKSVPYIGNEVHSGYLEILIDTGLLGFLLLVGMLFWLVFKMRSRASVAWAPAALLLAHSAIDFDWSYGYAWLLLLLWFALHLRESEEGGMDAAPRPRSAGRKRLAAAPLAAALLLGFAAAALPAAWRSLAAASERESALAAAPSARAAGLRAALESNPAWSRVRLELYPLLRGQERVELLARGLRYDPQSPALEFQLGMAYAELAQPEPAAAHLREALRLDRFDREAQNAAIATMAAMAERYAAAGRDDRAAVAAGAAVDMFERYRELYRFTYEGKTNPWENKVNSLFGSAKFNAASSLLLLGRDEEATALLQEVAEESSEEWGRLAKEKLASLTSE
nr:O-antigen ligase family protein [Cohnella thailandensis]